MPRTTNDAASAHVASTHCPPLPFVAFCIFDLHQAVPFFSTMSQTFSQPTPRAMRSFMAALENAETLFLLWGFKT